MTQAYFFLYNQYSIYMEIFTFLENKVNQKTNMTKLGQQ